MMFAKQNPAITNARNLNLRDFSVSEEVDSTDSMSGA
jgi:hypothetical protein